MNVADAQEHFDLVAARYSKLRTTDCAPVQLIAGRLARRPHIVVDVGAGDGRYTERLHEVVPAGSLLLAAELNRAMLGRLAARSTGGGIVGLRCRGEALPLADRSIDVVTTFNAVQHFDLQQFADEAGRVVRPGGHVFVYTRTPQQNATSIWGRRFPEFVGRETRLHTEDALRSAFAAIGTVQVTPLRFVRNASVARLAEQVRGRHYSTFSLYDDDELEAAVEAFLAGLDGEPATSWIDQNLMVHVHAHS